MDNTHTFSVDIKTPNQRYEGTFTVKKLSVREIAQMGVRRIQMNGGLHYDPSNPGKGLDPMTDEFNAVFAHLELAIVKSPDWWDLDELADFAVVSAVYQEVLDFEARFLGYGKDASNKGPGRSSEDNSSAAQSEADDDRHAPELVGEDVQSALEP